MPTPEQIAAGLSEKQRKAIRSFTPDWAYQTTYWTLTPTGLAVRAILEKQA